MDQAMVKRGIGAVVLAIIAALLLGYLLKDKSRERQEVVDIKLPDTTELNIPELGGPTDTNTESHQAENQQGNSISLLGEAGNTDNRATDSTGNTVVASANAVTSAAPQTAGNINTGNINNNGDMNNPGFSIRPPMQNETREIVDVDNSATENTASTNTGSAAIAYSTDPVNEVIASSKKQATKKFKPSIVEEKKKPEQQAKTQTKSTTQKAATTTKTSSKALGKYSIQLLATSSQSRAAKLAKTMKSEGYTVFVTQTQSNNKILFRVRVGAHAERADAVKAQAGMKRRYQKNFFVQNSLVVSN